MVHDESVTFFNYIASGRYIPFLDWQSHADANNHVLNSALSRLFYNWFGSEPWALRMGSMITLPFLFVYTYKIGKWLKSPAVRWAFLLSIVGSHYFIEFFSLTRGYGMSMAFLMGAIYYILRYLDEPKTLSLVLYSVFMILGLSANLTLVNTALIGCVLITYKFIREREKSSPLIQVAIILFGVLAPLGATVFTGYMYNEMDLLYYGIGDSYWAITVTTFFERFTLIENLNLFVYPIVMPLILLSLVFMVTDVLKYKWKLTEHKHAVFALFFFGNLFGSIIQTSFMDVNYPEDRTALFFFPFMIGMWCFKAETKAWLKWTLLPLAYLPINFLLMINTRYNSFWKNERMPERIYNTLKAEYDETGIAPTIGGYKMRQVVWDYYNFQHDGWLNGMHRGDYPNDTISDYLLVEQDHNPYWSTLYEKLDYVPESNLSLLKRRVKLTPTLVAQMDEVIWIENDAREYINFHRYIADIEAGAHYMAEFELDFRAHNAPADAWLVLQGISEDGSQSFYNYFSLERYRKSFDHEMHTVQKVNTIPIPEGTVELRTYIWNLNKEPITAINGMVKIYKY